ncbi:arsenate reductase (azurin) small subunit [Burkholderia multivorans]|uniref:arsenate reductase (azurin) small subunit n=1 Tax=Burkholderia TaxID=32008 RepID=UPI000A1A1277|nr:MULTISPECIES: arsenate reductase (azurin) small subunit [Burkholderia]ARL04425.1 arsenite oxidase small subunit [Burkholderia pseudomallei]MBU9468724.1 arsenate reductase (azurin) small subunit [Burkholderia multivorans]MCA8129647.1 arsenate reductase (azurin) small subunit [Burkholderia multivorans]
MSKETLSRRTFLKISGTSVAATAAVIAKPACAAGVATTAAPATSHTLLPYVARAVANASQLAQGTPFVFNYPDAASPCVAVKLGVSAPGGVGPNRDIVAYSMMCTHMGCPVAFDAGTNTFKCGCHYSMFDAEKSGQMIAGQATENLPRIRLNYDDKTGRISAVGIDGMLYGRQANVL